MTPSSTTKPPSSSQAVYCAVTDRARPDVAGKDAGEKGLGVGTVDPVLEQRRRVEQPGAVADREVLELLGRLVFLGDEVPGPVLPQARLVGRAGPVVERGRADHRADGRASIAGGRARPA